MKFRNLFIICFLVFSLFSCSEENSTEPTPTTPQKMIIGDWLLSTIIVNNTEKTPIDYKATSYLRFYENGRFLDYSKFGKYVVDYKGTYTISSYSFCSMKAEDPRNPEITYDYTLNIEYFTNDSLIIRGFATVEEQGEKVLYPALLLYIKN